MDTFTLLIWEVVPEETRLYLIPNSFLDDERWGYLTLAHKKMINGDEMNDGLRYLNNALDPHNTVEEWDDEDFNRFRGELVSFCRSEEDDQKPWTMTDTMISRVVLSGFIL